MDSNAFSALMLTVFAGISTGLGSLIALFAKRTNTKFLSLSLGFSAGVMLYVSMIEIFSKAREYLQMYTDLQKATGFVSRHFLPAF